MNFWIDAEWPTPAWIKAGITTTHSGFSLPPYAGLNLAGHVGDEIERVRQNRNLLEKELNLPSTPLWLQQVHGQEIIEDKDWFPNVSADACFSKQNDSVCAILTADCLPLLLCDEKNRQVAAVHIGWRGLCQNIVSASLSRFDSDHGDILAWIGPHIHAANYEVGEDARQACLTAIPDADHAFTKIKDGYWLANLETLVRHQLEDSGNTMIFAANRCTFKEQSDFYSYRRNNITGRMASLIWMESGNI
jgi:YfiH family protein